jgi:hypothetical protein
MAANFQSGIRFWMMGVADCPAMREGESLSGNTDARGPISDIVLRKACGLPAADARGTKTPSCVLDAKNPGHYRR